MPAKIVYISTNEIWSGSECLWFESAKALLSNGHMVSIALKYETIDTKALKTKLHSFIKLGFRFSKLTKTQRFANKFFTIFTVKDLLAEKLNSLNPDLIIISQGNNIASLDIIELCSKLRFKFVTITQLVSEIHWLWLNEDNQKRLKAGYEKAVKNFFVSKLNLALHNFMFAYTASNNEVISNPILIKNQLDITYPTSTKNYAIAFVGRIECFHKGLDFFVQLITAEKWKLRPVVFNLYGTGPHSDIIQDQLAYYGITNVHLRGHASLIEDVWQQNQILILPSRMEGQSLALIEALYCNRAAIVTNVGGASEIIEDSVTGFIAKVASLRDIDDAMERAWSRRDEWELMGIAAGKRIRQLMPADSVQLFNDKILNLLRQDLAK